jgi:Predicted membrane protein (DUF2085)
VSEQAIERKSATGLTWGAIVLGVALVAFLLIPVPLVDKFYAIGFGICPQRAGHSYFLGETLLPGEASVRAAVPLLNLVAPDTATKLPVEARMFGMFAGFLITWLYSFAIGRGKAALMPTPLLMFTFIVFIGLMGIDGVNATVKDLHTAGLPVPYLYEPRLDVRFVTGWLCGIAMAGIVLPVVNFCLWRDAEPKVLFARWRVLLPLLGIGLVILGLFTTGSGLFYYPLAVLAPVGILTTLGSLNVVLVLTLGRRERVAANWREALNPIALALLFSAFELGLLSLMRYAAFGWGAIG